MSRNTGLKADLDRIGYQLSGAHLTRQARSATFNTFTLAMRDLGYFIETAQQIGGRHLQAFIRHRAKQGISARTQANEISHLRSVLEHIGKQGMVRSPELNNRALGIERGSRIGSKQPLSDAAILAFQERMAQLDRPGIGCLLELQRALGLREAEAVRSGQAQTLARWTRELCDHGCVRVIEGTKGGRPRNVHPANLERATIAIQRAQSVLEATGQRYLIARGDGTRTSNLRQALTVYRNICHRAGIQSHGARYAFAGERIQTYRDQGYGEREARSATSLDLGHGDGRGRYVVSVYVRT